MVSLNVNNNSSISCRLESYIAYVFCTHWVFIWSGLASLFVRLPNEKLTHSLLYNLPHQMIKSLTFEVLLLSDSLLAAYLKNDIVSKMRMVYEGPSRVHEVCLFNIIPSPSSFGRGFIPLLFYRSGYQTASQKFNDGDLDVDCSGKVFMITGMSKV